MEITHIPFHEIHPSPMNPRKHFDEESIKELASSIKEKGLIQPITVRPNENGYEIVAGERRYRAISLLLQDARFSKVDCIVRPMTDEEALEIMIIENLQRKDVHPMEEAAGFLQLSNVKHMDAKEIGLRVGKSQSYVAQRMKLNDLIPEIQKFFFQEGLSIKDALTLAAMHQDDQFEFYDQRLKDASGLFTISNWDLQRFRHRLNNAPFDTTDPELIPSVGACTNCQFNSHSNSILFPELAKDPNCTNKACFQKKCDTSFKNRLAQAKEDPTTVVITGQYSPDAATQKLMKQIDGVLAYGAYDEIDEPEFPDRSDFEDDDYDTPAEAQQAFDDAIKDYEKEKAAFEKKIGAGSFQKAFVLGGHSQGKYVYIKRSKSTRDAKTVKSKGVDLKEDAGEIKAEISRIQDRQKRAIELDDAKIWPELRKLCDPKKVATEISGPLSQVERNAVAAAIYKKLGFGTSETFTRVFKGKKVRGDGDFGDVSVDQLNGMVRFFFAAVLADSPQINGKMDPDEIAVKRVVDSYWPKVTAPIYKAQEEIAARRAERVAARIKSLQVKLKELQQPKPKTLVVKAQDIPEVKAKGATGKSLMKKVAKKAAKKSASKKPKP